MDKNFEVVDIDSSSVESFNDAFESMAKEFVVTTDFYVSGHKFKIEFSSDKKFLDISNAFIEEKIEYEEYVRRVFAISCIAIDDKPLDMTNITVKDSSGIEKKVSKVTYLYNMARKTFNEEVYGFFHYLVLELRRKVQNMVDNAVQCEPIEEIIAKARDASEKAIMVQPTDSSEFDEGAQKELMENIKQFKESVDSLQKAKEAEGEAQAGVDSPE